MIKKFIAIIMAAGIIVSAAAVERAATIIQMLLGQLQQKQENSHHIGTEALQMNCGAVIVLVGYVIL
jgi:carbohydrate-selective porin OprB